MRLLNKIYNMLGLATIADVEQSTSKALNKSVQILRDKFTQLSKEKGEYCVRGSLKNLNVHKVGEKLGDFMDIEQEFYELRNLIGIYENNGTEFFKEQEDALSRIADINAIIDQAVEEVDTDDV